MRFHCIQHVPFEGPGSIRPWLEAGGHALVPVHPYAGEPLPAPAAVEGLIVMGGPMSVHDEAAHPWLAEEKRFLEAVLAAGRPLLGICLGGQLLAQVLGAEVVPGPHKEIGWFEVSRAPAVADAALGGFLPPRLRAFHWHGETFGIPAGALHLASSEACSNQGFVYAEQVVALQFHLETTPESARALIEHGADDLLPGPYVQTPETMLAEPARFAEANGVMGELLARLVARAA